MEKQWGRNIYCITAHRDDIQKIVRKKKRQGLVSHGGPLAFGGKSGWVIQPMVDRAKSDKIKLFC